MAVNVSTTASICLYCKTSSEGDAEKEFHEIYDEVGVELQLPTLVEKFFHIKVQHEQTQRLCDDCVNRLIELFDLEEHAKEEKGEADDSIIRATSSGSSIQEPQSAQEEKNKNLTQKDCTLLKEKEITGQNKDNIAEYLEQDIIFSKNDTIESIKLEIIAHTQGNVKEQNQIDLEEIERPGNKNNEFKNELVKNVETKIFNENIADNSNSQNILQVIFEEKTEVQTETDSSGACGSEYNEDDTAYAEGNDEANFVIENLVNTNLNTHEFEIINENQIDDASEEEIELNSEEEINHKLQLSKQNDNDIHESLYENEEMSESLLDSSTIDSQNDNNQDLIVEEIHLEELEDVVFKEEESLSIIEKTNNDESIDNEQFLETDIKSLNTNVNDKQTICTDDIEIDEIIEKDVDDVGDDTYSIEEEYLIEEIACSQEYDCVDLNKYLEKVLVTKFTDLELDWNVECKLCLEKYQTFQDLLNHSCIKEFEDEQLYSCIIKDCEENINNLNTLARHLVLRHYDKLESTFIYGKCPDCQKTFSNFLDFNKHSCCRTIKKRAGSRNYCQSCDMDFQSLKRYVFHMQFHLTNHRPKVCLLCGDLFNNSNDFFEHTQYKHNPDAALACIKCDRFFKDKEVFDSHMELHEDSKYQFACIYCPKMYTNKIGLNQHMDIYHNNKSKAMLCEYCEKEFVNNTSYRNHMKCHATDVQVESFICCACGFITNNDDCIRDHTETDKDSPCYASPIDEQIIGFGYTCENCSLDFQTIKQLKEHRLSSIHSDDVFHCGICRREFKNLRQMRNHTTNHKEMPKWEEAFPITRYFVCNIGDCQESYPIWTSLYYHKKRPHKTAEDKPKEFKCQFCQQICSSKMSLAVHVARSHNNSNISCTHCKQSYRSQKLLQEHIDKFHTPVKCDICLKDFKHRRNLESHNQLVHLNVKRYFCSHCEKGYFYKSEKDAHENKVHPEFSYKCGICNFITNYPKSLEIHMDKHNNQQKFKCTICNKTFGRKQLLNVHLKRHQNKKEYLCSKYVPEINCSAAFYTHNQLKTHIENKHPDAKYINNNKRKRNKKNSLNTLSIEEDEEDSYDIYTDDNDCVQAKHSKTCSTMLENDYNDNDYDYEQDTNELTLENEMELVEQKSDDETICA